MTPRGSSCWWVGSAARFAVRREEFVEERDGRVRVDGGAFAEGVVPAGLERLLEVVSHALGGVGVEATHAWDLVAETLLGEDLRDAILGHPGLVAVPEPVRGEAAPDREPAGERGVFRDGLDASSSWWSEGLGAGVGERPHGDRDTGPERGVGDDQPCRPGGCRFKPPVTGGAEHTPGIVLRR